MSMRMVTMYDASGRPVQVDPRAVLSYQRKGFTLTPPKPEEGYGPGVFDWGAGSGFAMGGDYGSAYASETPEERIARMEATPQLNYNWDEYNAQMQAEQQQRTQDVMGRVQSTMRQMAGRVAGFGQMDIMNYVHADPYGNLYWKDSADQSAVDNLMRLGSLSEQEANSAIMRVEAALGIRPAGEFVELGPSQNMPFPPAGAGLFGDPWGGGGGGGGGGGRVGPTYRAPDRRTVEENVRNQMVALIGAIEPQNVQKVTDAYMRDHRKAWEGASLDPNMTILEELRGLDSYQKIHKLRPDSASEATWVSQHRSAWQQGGGRIGEAEGKAQQLATIGATASADNATLSEFGAGFETNTFRSRMANAAKVAASKVR